jgi:PAS domain S-box-containing protein
MDKNDRGNSNMSSIFNINSPDIESRLQFNQKFLGQITDNSPQILYVLNVITLTNIYVNQYCTKILGYTAEEFSQRGSQIFFDILHPEDLPLLFRNVDFWKTAKDDDILMTEYRMRNKNGDWIWLRSQDVVFERDENNQVITVLGTAQNITEYKTVEKTLRETQERFERFAKASPAVLYIVVGNEDGTMDFEYLNPAFETINEVSVEEAMKDGSIVLKQIHPEDVKGYQENVIKTMETLKPFSHEWRIITPSNKIKWIKANSSPMKRPNGDIAWHGVITDITEKKEAELAVVKAKKVAEDANRAKSEFLANMSHEIRTPMNGVLSMAEVLLRTPLTPQQKNMVQTIVDSGKSLLVILNDILDLSKIQSGMLALQQNSLILKDIIISVLNLFTQQASEKSIDLDYFINPDVPRCILGDATRLRQVLFNLVGNAIKFTEEGEVFIFVSSKILADDNHEIRISIKDTGIGISKENLNRLFQSFSQGDTTIDRKYGGTGLGLAICKNLVSLMDGNIWGESNGMIGGNPPQNWVSMIDIDEDNQGSIFHFTFITQEVLICELTNTILTDIPEKMMSKKVNLKILIAEDYKLNQTVIQYLLETLDYTGDIVDNGLQVLEILEKQFYDVILMDMQMPEMDGITATKIIRQSEQKQPYIIALTANALEDDRIKCMEAGMNDYISKPISIEELKIALETAQLRIENQEI